MGLVIAATLAASVWFLLWRKGRLRGARGQMLGAALLLGLAGYALQGRVGAIGSPAAARPPQPLPPTLQVELAATFYERFTAATPWIVIANGYMAGGDSARAVATLTSAVRQSPRESQLWLALGNALVTHGGGRPSPASELAFNRALELAPTHPGPRFFYGLSLLTTGEAERGLAQWRTLFANAPVDAPWRYELGNRIASLMKVLETPNPAEPGT